MGWFESLITTLSRKSKKNIIHVRLAVERTMRRALIAWLIDTSFCLNLMTGYLCPCAISTRHKLY